MSLRATSRRAIGYLDKHISSLGTKLERPGLLSFVFHAIFEDARQIEAGVVSPQEGLTKDDFRRFIEYLSEGGYEFVSSAQIQGGLAPGNLYALITFDDGYANNWVAVEVLDDYGVPAIIFVTTDRVELNRCFWWDVLYRERRKRGSSDSDIDNEMRWLKSQPHNAIDPYLESTFGASALRPVSDLDRPFGRDELSDLARNALVTVGNHTKSHAILTRLEPGEVRSQFEEAQEYLEAAIGRRPEEIAYPNGDYDRAVLDVARATGFRVGVTADQRKNPVPSTESDVLALGRYVMERDADLVDQLRVWRSELQLANLGRRVFRRRISNR